MLHHFIDANKKELMVKEISYHRQLVIIQLGKQTKKY